ncbi:ComEA family DNA-binding protein [Streptomyces sp. NPDC058953]|uniref:ComEA family DNA-binding protein n=1 Tax=unclassified Streptomyces TaxID=2593676 RepID=UPI0036BEF772
MTAEPVPGSVADTASGTVYGSVADTASGTTDDAVVSYAGARERAAPRTRVGGTGGIGRVMGSGEESGHRGRRSPGPRDDAPRQGDALRRAGFALGERLPLWVRLRCGLEPRTLAALAVVLVAAVVLAGVHFWSGRPQMVRPPEPVRREARSPMSAPTSASVPVPVPGASPEVSPGGRVVVDVGGKVRRPGILRLPVGSRVADALAAAGGAKEDTDLTGLNRARVLVDGEQVLVGVAGPAGTAAVSAPAAGADPGGAGPAGTGPVSLNTATLAELDTLPGVGPVLARHIMEYRSRGGGFRSVDELREVDGIGERRFADLRPLVRP